MKEKKLSHSELQYLELIKKPLLYHAPALPSMGCPERVQLEGFQSHSHEVSGGYPLGC
jgi:hypothetical protein